MKLFEKKSGMSLCAADSGCAAYNPPIRQANAPREDEKKEWIKRVEEVWFVFWLVFSLCGALGGARPINPQREETKPNQQTLRSKTTTPFLCWLSMPSRKERNCFVFCFGLPRSFWLLGAGSTHKPNQSAPFLLHWIISFHFIIQNKEESKLKLIGLFAPLFLSASFVFIELVLLLSSFRRSHGALLRS